MTKNDASEGLGQIIPLLRQGWELAFTDILTTYNNPDWNNRCRSNVLQMQAVIHIRHLLGGVPGIRYLNFATRDLWEVDGFAILRLKQLDEKLLSSNYPTDAAEAFNRQEELPGLEFLPRLTVGIVPKVDWTAISGTYIVYPKWSGANNWVLDITDNGEEAQQTIPDEIITPPRRILPRRRTGEAGPGRADVQS